jgi:hypothetical protein
MSDTVFMVEGVPTPCNDNLEMTLVYPKDLRGQLKPRGLYVNRDGVMKVYRYLIGFVDAFAPPRKDVLIYAKKDFLDKLSAEEKAIDPETIGRRKLHFVHFGTGRGFNEWRDCETYIRLADFYMGREDAVAHTGSVLNRVFTDEDLTVLSSGRGKDPAVESLGKLRLLSAAVQDAARSALRNLDENGRPRKPVKVFLIEPDQAVVNTLRILWPGLKDPKVIGDPRWRPEGNGKGLRAVKAALAFLDHREKTGKPWTSEDFARATKTRTTSAGC